MKKILLGLGSIASIAAPIAAVISCGKETSNIKPAPIGAIVGLNVKEVIGVAMTGIGNGVEYTQRQIDARDEINPAPTGAVEGHNTPEFIAVLHKDKVGLGNGVTYTKAQIDAYGASAAPVGKVAGDSIPGGGDHFYTQANIDKRDGGDKVAPKGAVVGLNSPEVVAIPHAAQVGNGDGHTYTQSQIDKRDGGDKVAPMGAVVGINNSLINAVMQKGDGSGNTYTQAQIDLRDKKK